MDAKVALIKLMGGNILIVLMTAALAACGTAPQPPTQHTPSATRTVAPSPTITPEPSSTAVNWPALDIPSVVDTPTLLATPVVSAAAYRLHVWDEQAALGLVEKAEHFAYDDNTLFPPNESRYNYQADQLPIRLAAQEALIRFPNALLKDKLEWRVALANSIVGEPEADTWILDRLEVGLNKNRYTLENLNEALAPYAFGVNVSGPVSNLFGDGRPARVLQVHWLYPGSDSATTGLYAGLEKDAAGSYRLVHIYSTWAFTHDHDNTLVMEDHTGDRIPEIIIAHGTYNGSYCGTNTLMFQWQKDHFVDISRDQFSVSECSTNVDEWKYAARDANGAETIEVRRALSYESGTIEIDTYRWNGEQYELAKSHVEPPERIDWSTTDWPVYAMVEGDYAALIQNIPAFLSAAERVDTAALGPGYPDYLHFQLGLAYILQGNRTQGLAVLRDLAAQPRNPAGAVPRAAQAYLEHASGGTDTYRACRAALAIMAQAAGEHFHKSDSVDIDALKTSWGYYAEPYGDTGTLCSLLPVFYQLVNKLAGTQFDQADEQLRRAGVLLRSAEQVDLKGDGVAEWLLLVDTSGDEAPAEIWILVKAGPKVIALPVVEGSRRAYDLPDYGEEVASGLTLKTILSPNGKTTAFVSVGEHLYIFQLGSGSAPTLDRVGNWRDVQNYSIHQEAGELEVEIAHTKHDCEEGCSTILKWSNEKSKLVYDWDLPDKTGPMAEAALLSRHQPDEAIPLLQTILKNPDVYNAAYFTYLLGLAYELKGDQSQAAATYWELWRKYPESAYARLVAAKLEVAK